MLAENCKVWSNDSQIAKGAPTGGTEGEIYCASKETCVYYLFLT